MYICIALLLIAFLPHLQLSADVPTAKTFFKLSNAPLWLSPESLPFQYTKKPTDAPIQNGFTLTAFYSRSTEKKQTWDKQDQQQVCTCSRSESQAKDLETRERQLKQDICELRKNGLRQKPKHSSEIPNSRSEN